MTNELVVYWGSTYEQRWSLTHLLGRDLGLVADLAAVAAMLVIARRSRGHGPEAPLAAGVAATFLIAYHLTPPDFVVLLVPVWILAMERSRIGVAAAVLGWLAAWFAVGLAVPVILFELAVLGLCAAWAGRPSWTSHPPGAGLPLRLRPTKVP
jgi:hypothetical protein